MTNPDWLPTMRRASGVVTDGGGITCHAAIVSRELGIPCVVGARTATSTLRAGQIVTVDGGAGLVLEGASRPAAVTAVAQIPTTPEGAAPPVTATRLYVNLALAEKAEQVAALPVDGVGLLRAEFLVTEALQGRHPRAVLAAGGREEFLERHGDVALDHHPRVRPAAGRVPHDRLPDQRVPSVGGRRGLRARGAQPDDRLQGLLPLHP